jgi:serine/threonine protein kinase
MGCLFSCFDKQNNVELAEKLVKSGSKEEDKDKLVEADFDDFSEEKARQILVVDPAGKASNKVSVNDFTMLKVLGKGSFGKVVMVEKKDTGNIYAMKILKKEAIKKRNQKIHTKAEREILENMNSLFVVQLYYAFQTPSKLYLIMDFMNGGELFFHLRKDKKFSENRAKFYAAEIILALEHLHSKGVIYRDLKPENILMDCDGHIKICDFGLSKQGIQGDTKAYTFCGTPEYLAPEILKGIGHDKAVDYWSLGALLYEMLAGMPPFYSRDRNQMFRNILEKPVEMKPHFTPEACSLLSALLVVPPSKRMSNPYDMKRHEFFRGIDWEKLQRREVKPPFRPNVSGIKDLRYFDKMFTEESVNETPLFRTVQAAAGNNTFQGFTYDPPEAE